jgi:hypothetical protein
MKMPASSALAMAALMLAGLGCATNVHAADDVATTTMNAEIDYLLDAVATSNCVFVRNGKEHDAQAARKHLQTKRKRGRRYFDSAEEFIERLASSSSWSGKDYTIRCGDDSQTAKAWFTIALERYRDDRTGRPE